jgi:hypothetical protein
MNPALEAIASRNFILRLGMSLPTGGMHLKLASMPEVSRLRASYAEGSVSAQEIQECISSIFARLVRGKRLAGEESLAAIVVALSQVFDDFSGEVIDTVSSIEVAELPLAPRIARFCKALRKRETQNTPRQEIVPLRKIDWKIVALRNAPPVDVTRARIREWA